MESGGDGDGCDERYLDNISRRRDREEEIRLAFTPHVRHLSVCFRYPQSRRSEQLVKNRNQLQPTRRFTHHVNRQLTSFLFSLTLRGNACSIWTGRRFSPLKSAQNCILCKKRSEAKRKTRDVNFRLGPSWGEDQLLFHLPTFVYRTVGNKIISTTSTYLQKRRGARTKTLQRRAKSTSVVHN